MDRDWTRAVYRITGPDDNSRGQGTGFACAREGGDLLLVTCWHVVREIGPDQLRIHGQACELVSDPGDDQLDLAVLRAPGLAGKDVLQLAAGGETDLEFETYGYGPTGRPLSGVLGAALRHPHASHEDVAAWDYYLSEDSRKLETVEPGCSGAPVWDPRARRVLAVITHRQGSDKGFAIDEAAARLGKSARQVRYLIQNGSLRANKINGRWLIETDDLPLSIGRCFAQRRRGA